MDASVARGFAVSAVTLVATIVPWSCHRGADGCYALVPRRGAATALVGDTVLWKRAPLQRDRERCPGHTACPRRPFLGRPSKRRKKGAPNGRPEQTRAREKAARVRKRMVPLPACACLLRSSPPPFTSAGLTFSPPRCAFFPPCAPLARPFRCGVFLAHTRVSVLSCFACRRVIMRRQSDAWRLLRETLQEETQI